MTKARTTLLISVGEDFFLSSSGDGEIYGVTGGHGASNRFGIRNSDVYRDLRASTEHMWMERMRQCSRTKTRDRGVDEESAGQIERGFLRAPYSQSVYDGVENNNVIA